MGAGPAQKKSGDLILEADGRWGLAGSKKCRWWAWVARDARTRRGVAVVAGGRDEFTARCRWDALPDEYRGGAIVCTDFLAAYRAAVPRERHAAGGTGAGLTCPVERFWATVRARCSRFVRKARSYSKCAWNHVGSLWYFIRHYNASLL